MGSRYGGLKQLEPVGPESHGGATIMDYSVFDAMRTGFGKVVFIIRESIEVEFKRVIGRKFEQHLQVEYVYQEIEKLPSGLVVPEGRSKPWGTTHAVLMAADVIHEPFAVINADDFYGRQSYTALADELHRTADEYLLVGFPLKKTLSKHGSVARGVCEVDEDKLLTKVVEWTKIQSDGDRIQNRDAEGNSTRFTGDEIVSMNMWGFTPAIFPSLEKQFEKFLQRSGSSLTAECYLPSAMNELVQAGAAKVRVIESTEDWFGVTYREDRPMLVERIRKLVESGKYPERLWA